MIEHGLKIIPLQNQNEINIVKKNDVASQIKTLIKKHNLDIGDKLPSERKLSEKLGLSRNQIRAGIQKLEFYRIIETLPQSGSVLTGIGVPSINTIMADVLDLELPDFKSLVETLVIIESNAVQLTAVRCTEASLKNLEEAHDNFVNCVTNDLPSLIEDLKFHLAIVKASENTVLYSLMKIIVPDITGYFSKEHICDRTRAVKLVNEHQKILDAIKKKDPEQALQALCAHYEALREFIKSN